MTKGRMLLVDDALAVAAQCEEVVVIFQHTDHPEIGWRAHVHASNGRCVLSLPWADHVDRLLVAQSERLPFGAAIDALWEDMDQGWFSEVLAVGRDVFVAETLDEGWLPGVGSVSIVCPDLLGWDGRVTINGAEVRVSTVPRSEWERAWTEAKASCLAALPQPVVIQWTDTEVHRDE